MEPKTVSILLMMEFVITKGLRIMAEYQNGPSNKAEGVPDGKLGLYQRWVQSMDC